MAILNSPITHIARVRSWRFGLFIVLTLLLVIPLYELRDHSYYQRYVYDKLSGFLHENGIYNNTLYQGNEDSVHQQYNFSDTCRDFPDTSGVLLVMKTGATEVFEKLPTHFVTGMQCLPDSLVFSDLEQQIGQYHIYDALDDLNETIKRDVKEWKLYDAQQACPISQKDCTKGMEGGWDLDKYKFLHMAVKTWQMRPNYEWYVWGEADTYFVWPNLMEWLRNHQPEDQTDAYIGSVALIANQPFAHGGSGYVISGSLLQKIVEIPDVALKYDIRAQKECCGDLLISLAAMEAGTKVLNAHPMFNGEKPNTLPYGHGQWCEPLLTMHHVNPEELSAIWQYEQTRKASEPLLIREMYDTFFAPHLVSKREDWTNLSDDICFIGQSTVDQDLASGHERGRQKPEQEKNVVERHAHENPDACARVCEAHNLDIPEAEYEGSDDATRARLIRAKYDEKADDTIWKKERRCFQWRYHAGTCCVQKSFKFGTPKVEKDPNQKTTSGWFVEGVKAWIEATGECESPAWKTPH